MKNLGAEPCEHNELVYSQLWYTCSYHELDFCSLEVYYTIFNDDLIEIVK